jgi:hypothetical protein
MILVAFLDIVPNLNARSLISTLYLIIMCVDILELKFLKYYF